MTKVLIVEDQKMAQKNLIIVTPDKALDEENF